jgi:hypothetical protein
LAAFVDADPAFGIVRRFGHLYAQNVLLKQDRLADLEAQLNDLDVQEDVRLFLSSRRLNQNQERARLLEEIDNALHEYGSYQ